MIKLRGNGIKMKPRLLPGLVLFFRWFEKAFFEFLVLLAFLDDVIAVVVAEVGEPAFRDTPDAVGFGGAEVFVIQPSLHRAEVISE